MSKHKHVQNLAQKLPKARRFSPLLEALEERLAPATSITSVSSLFLSSSDRTLIEIGGPQAGDPPGGNDIDGFDQFRVANNATVDGTLQIQLVNGYVPEVGTEFDFMNVGGALSGTFDRAEGLFSFPEGDRYFQLVQGQNQLKLVVAGTPGGLTYAPSEASRDGFGMFLSNDYFHATQFTYTGSMSADLFTDVDGTFLFEDRGSTLVAGSANASVFLGTAFGQGNQTGVVLNDTRIGFVLKDSGYALSTSGAGAFAGLPGLNIDADFTVITNTTGLDVNTTVNTSGGPVLVDVPGDDGEGNAPRSFSGQGRVWVDGSFTMAGDILVTEIAMGTVLFDVTDMDISLTTGALEVFRFSGLTRFAIDHVRGFQLVDMSFNDTHVLGVDVQAATGPLNSLTYPDDEPASVAFTSIIDAVDVAMINHRRYFDITFQSPTGKAIDPASILDNNPEFYFGGSALEDAAIDYVVQLEGNTYRYYLIDSNTSNSASAFAHDLFRVNENFSNTRLNLIFTVNAWTDIDGVGSAATTISIDVRSGVTIADANVEIGPVVFKGPYFNLEDLQYRRLANPADGSSLVIAVGMGADEATLKFGGDSPSLKTSIKGLLGTYTTEAVIATQGEATSNSSRFRIRVDSVELEIKNILKAKAEGVYVTYDPLRDRNHDGTVSEEEQTAYNQQEIVRVDTASVEITKIGLVGELKPFTRPSPGVDPDTGYIIPGTTIPGLSVRNDGFRLGEASLQYTGELSFGSLMKIKGIKAGVQDLGVTYGTAFEFDGAVFIAADKATLFPGKKFELTLTDGSDSNSEAVRTTLKFTDNLPSGFAFSVDQGMMKFGSTLTVYTSQFEIDTTNTGVFPVVSFGAIGATLSAGSFKVGGEMRNFGFLETGAIKTFAGFGLFVSLDKVDGKSFKWPDWMPIRITELGIQWRDLNNKPEDFRIIVSAAVDKIKGLPNLELSGAIEGIEIDLGLLFQGKFPITGIESMGITAKGNLFGGEVTAGLIGGIIKIDVDGNEVGPLDQITPIVDRVFFVGLQGGFKIAGQGGFTIRMALTEKGPLGVQVTGDLPEGILLEPISGLKLSGFSGGVEFFKTMSDAYKPEDLLDPNFAPALTNASAPDADAWLAATRRQVIAQHRALKENPVGGGFLAAFLNPMIISGGGQIVFHTPESVLKINAEVRISIDPNVVNGVPGIPKVKILITGDIILFGGLQRCPARIFADLSKIADGNAKLLLMAQDIPTGVNPLLLPLTIPTSMEIRGLVSLKYFGPNGEEVDFYDDTPTATGPSALLMEPGQGGQISHGQLSANRHVDVKFRPSEGATLDAASVTDVAPELELVLPNGTRVTLSGTPLQVDGLAENVYRFALPANLNLELGSYQVQVIENSWQDTNDQTNPAETLPFTVIGAAAELSGPADGDRIDRKAINGAGRLAIRFLPTPSAIVDASSVVDAAPEIALIGAAAAGVLIGAPVRDENDDQLYYYPFTGTFGIGTVQVRLLAGAFTDSRGNSNLVQNYSFTVTGPEMQLRDPANGTALSAAEINARGFIEVFVTQSGTTAIDEASLIDASAEFTLSGAAAAGVVLSGVAVPVAGEPGVYRYAFTGSFSASGQVAVEFLAGSFRDAEGVLSATRNEAFTIRGILAELSDPLAFTTAGLSTINDRGYIDIRFTATAGATLDAATILDPAAELTLTGEAAEGVTLSGVPTSLGNGVYRYTFTGAFVEGEVTVNFLANSATDSAGFRTTADEVYFVLAAPSAEMYSLSNKVRADRSKINDAGYIDILFNDLTGQGLDEASIIDADDEFQFLVLNEAGTDWIVHPFIGINGAGLRNADGSYRYFFSGQFNPGVVRVQFLENTFTDTLGARNLASEQQFVVVNNAPSFEFLIDGHVEYRTGFKAGLFGDLSNPEQLKDLLQMLEPLVGEIGGEDEAGYQALRDFLAGINTGLSFIQPFLTAPMLTLDGFIRLGSEVLLDGNNEISGVRTTLDAAGTVGVYLLGPVGSAAGRVVLQVDQNGINTWGVLELQAELKVLRKAGIDLKAFGTLQFNSTGQEQIESLTFPGMGPGGSDLTQTYKMPAYSLQVAAAGKMVLHVPTFDEANPFGLELFRINAVASLTISAEGLAMFVKGDVEVGPPDIRLLDIDALGVFIINDRGFAGDVYVSVAVGDIPAIRDYFQFDVFARVIFNVTGEEQEVKILDRFLEFLPADFVAQLDDVLDPPPAGQTNTFTNTSSKRYVVPAAPPPAPVDDGTPAPAGPYFVVMAEGNLTIGGVFRMHGDFYFEINATPEMFVTLNGSIALDPLGAATVSGTFHIDKHGAYGGLQIGASLTVGPFSVFGAAQFEFNTQSFAVQLQRYKYDFAAMQVTDQRETISVPPESFRIHIAGGLQLTNSFLLKGQFLLENRQEYLHMHIDARFDAFGANLLSVNGDAIIVKQGNVGFVANLAATIQAPFELDGVFEMNAQFQFQINTRSGNGSDSYDFGVPRNSFLVRFNGNLNLLSVLELSASGFIEYRQGVFRMQVAMNGSFFGFAQISASGFFSSEGEFELYFAGQFTFGVPGFLGVSAGGSIYVSLLDSNGTQPFGDGNTNLTVNGSINGTVWIFGFSFGANVGVNYSSSTGVLSITPSITINLLFFSITHTSTFNIGVLKVNPPIYVAGNADDTYGQPFKGGALYLNMGHRARLRGYSEGETGEHFAVEYIGSDPDGGHIVRVTGNNIRRTYRGVTEIIADGGSGRDFIEIGAGVPFPVTIRGGDENDRIRYYGNGNVYIEGGDGEDDIETYANSGTVEIYGGGDGDTIRHFGSARATIDGGYGDDIIQGGSGNDIFIFREGYGFDTITDLAGLATLDFDGTSSDLRATLLTGSALVVGTTSTRTNFADALVRVDGGDSPFGPTYAPVRIVHDGGTRLVVQHANHPFAEGDEIEIRSPDFAFGSALSQKPRWTISEVTADGYVLEMAADETGRGVEGKVWYADEAGASQNRDTVVLHDGVNTATVYHPGHTLEVGDTIYFDTTEASNYVGEFTITAVGEDWYAFSIAYALIRDTVTTNFEADDLILGLGNDRVITDGAQAVSTSLRDRHTGLDEVYVDGSLPSSVLLEDGGFSANDLHLTFVSGIDRLTLFAPTQAMQLNGASGDVDLGKLGVRVVADSLTFNTDIAAGHFVFETKNTLDINRGLNAKYDGYIDVRVFGDGANIVLTEPVTISRGDSSDNLGEGWIRLIAPDGSITGPNALDFTAPNAHLIYKAKNAPTGPLHTQLKKLTFAYGAHGTAADIVIIEVDDLILSAMDHIDTPYAPNLAFDDGTFTGINWLTTAPAGWLDQVNDGNDLFAVVVPNGTLKFELLAEDSLLYLESGQIVTQAAGKDMTFLVDDLSFRSGANQVIGTGHLTIQARHEVWNYRLGTAGENAAGSDLMREAFARSMDLTSGDLAALADGFAQIKIGREGAGNTMVIGDAMDAHVIKFTGQERDRDARIKDPLLLLTDSLTVAGDFVSLDQLEIRVGSGAFVQGPNLHVPEGAIDSGLSALELILSVGRDLQLSGWLIAAAVLEVIVGEDVTVDVGAKIETSADNNRFLIDAAGAMSIAGRLTAGGAGGKPELKAGGAFSLREGGSIHAPGANALIEIQSDVSVSMEPGTAVLAGVVFDMSSGSPVATVSGANSNVKITTPHEIYLPGTVAASKGIELTGGTPVGDHSAFFQSLVPADHPLHDRSQYSLLVTGTLLTFGDSTDLVLSSTGDVIVRGNIELRGTDSDLIIQSDSSVYFEGFADVADGDIKIFGGVELDGTDLGGADADGKSVIVYKTTRLQAKGEGNDITIRGSEDVDIFGALIAGGIVGSTGIAWTGAGDGTIAIRAGEAVRISSGVQASLSVTVKAGTPGADDNGLGIVVTPEAGINAAGLTGNVGATGLVRLESMGNIEMMGRIVAGATIVESPDGATFDFDGHADTDVEIVAPGRVYIGGNTVNIDGDPITTGGFIYSGRGISIDGGSHTSGVGVLIHPNSELSTNNDDGSIVITSDQDAEVRGKIASGGSVRNGIVSLFDGDSTLRIEAAHRVTISREVAAGQTITVIGGMDPIDPTDTASGQSVVVAGTGLLRTARANSLIDISGPQAIQFFSPLDLTQYNVKAPGTDSVVKITSSDKLTMAGRVQSYRDILFNNSTLPNFTNVELTETSLLETINGSITLDVGGSGIVRGSLTAGGVGSDVTILFSSDNLQVKGTLKAADEVVIAVPGVLDIEGSILAGNHLSLTAGTATVEGQTDLFIRTNSVLATTAENATMSLVVRNNVLIDGTFGQNVDQGTNDPAGIPYGASNLSTSSVESLSGDVTVTAANGRLEAGTTLTVKGRALDIAGVVRTSSSIAMAGNYDVTFDASGALKITGDVDASGSLLAKSPVSTALSLGTLRVTGNHLLRIETPTLTVGAAELVEGTMTERGGVIASGGRLEIVASDVVLRAGTQVLSTSDSSSIRIDADSLHVIGNIRGGGDIVEGAIAWAGNADVNLNIREMVTVGGKGYNDAGELVEIGGKIQATGDLDIAVTGGTAAVGFFVSELSTVQTDATGFGSLVPTTASSLQIITSKDLHIAGTVLAMDDGSDIDLQAGNLLRIDGFVQADDALTATAGENASGLSIYVRGTLNTGDAGSISLTGPKQVLIEGTVGQFRDDNGSAVIDTGRVFISTQAPLDVRGQVNAQKLIDIDASQINVFNNGAIRITHADGLLDGRATGNILVALGAHVVSSGSIHLFGLNVRVDGFVDNDNNGQSPRVLLNAVESVLVTGGVTSTGNLHLNAGVGANWNDEQLTGTITSAGLTGGLVRVEGAGKVVARGTLKAASGGDVELQADPEAPGAQRPVKTPQVSFQPHTINIVIGHRQVAAGIIYTPIVTWVDTRAEVQTGVELVRTGEYFHTMDVTLTEVGYYNGTTTRETFIHGIDYANSLADVTYNVFGRNLASGADNLIQDGGFNVNLDQGGVAVVQEGETIGAWTVTRGVVEHTRNRYQRSPGGGSSVDLDQAAPGAIAQTFATVPGMVYEVRFAMTVNSEPLSTRGMRVSAAGTSRDYSMTARASHNVENHTDWRSEVFTFKATGTETTLEFSSLSATGGNGVMISDVVTAARTVAGAPDDTSRPLANDGHVTYDFSSTPLSGRFNVYEAVTGDGPEFASITVWVSIDGVNFLEVTATEGAPIAIAGDEAHDDAFARSYDISGTGLTAVKFVRVVGVTADAFELDAVGGQVVNPYDVPIIDWAGDAPAAGASFNQLTQSQREIVALVLGYKPLYDFSFTNAQEHRTQNGSNSVVPWTPYWANAAKHIVEINLPGLQNRYIRLPYDAELDLARVVSQGDPTTFSEIVGTFRESAVVGYEQDRSAYTGIDDLDQSAGRWAVTYLHGGQRTYTLSDGTTGTLVAAPVWSTSADTEIGTDPSGRLVLAPQGYVASSGTVSNFVLLGVRHDIMKLDASMHPMLSDDPQPLTIFEYIAQPIDGYSIFGAARMRGGFVASINSARDQYWATTITAGGAAFIGAGTSRPGNPAAYFWYSGEPFVYTNWLPGFPTSALVNGIYGQDFVAINVSGPGWRNVYWNSNGVQGTQIGYLLERTIYEHFYDMQFDWASNEVSLEATRLKLNYQWVGQEHDLFTEIPVMELVDARVAIVQQVATTNWVAQAITEQQTVLKPNRVLVDAGMADYAIFTADSIKAEGEIVIDAARDVSLSGLVTAKNADGTAGSITIDAGRDFLMSGAKPAGSAETMQDAIAGMTAVSSITITAGSTFTLAESINITADDGNAPASTSNKIVVTATDGAIIRGTISTTNTLIGEITVNAGDDIELKGEIISGHVVNVFAGEDGVGGITSDVRGRIKTLGSEVHLRAGVNGGDIILTDLFIETSGPLEILAPSGLIANNGGLLAAGILKVSAQNGLTLGYIDARKLDAEVTGTGGITVYAFGSIDLDNVVTADGPITITGTGNIEVGTVVANGTLNLIPLTTISGNVPFADPLYVIAEGGRTITTATSELHLSVVTPGDFTVYHTGTGPLTIYATVMDGSLTINTGGDLIVVDLRLLSNKAGQGITLNADGDVLIGLINAGDYSATAEEASALRTTRGMAANAPFTSLTSVTIQAGGAIREIDSGDANVDIIAGSLTLKAGTGIDGLELAVNELTRATTNTGSITLTDIDGVGEVSRGLHVLEASAPAGGVSISVAGSLLVGSVTAGGAGQALTLTAVTGSLEVREHERIVAGLSSAGAITVQSGQNVTLAGLVTAGGAVSIDAQGTVSVKGDVTALDSVKIVAHDGHVVLPVDIVAQNGGTLSEIVLSASKNLNLVGGTLASVTNRLSLTAGAELVTGLAAPEWVVTGANGELFVSAGGDLLFLAESVLQADKRITLTSTGYRDAQGTAQGGTLSLIATPQGINGGAPRELVLGAQNYLHLHPGVTATEQLKLTGGKVTFTRSGLLRVQTDIVQGDGGASARLLGALAGSYVTFATTDLDLGAGTTLLPELRDPAAGPSDVINVTGTVTIGSNVKFKPIAANGFEPKIGDTFVILTNDGTDPINGRFAGLPEGAVVNAFPGTDLAARITYVGNADGGSVGNDIMLTAILATLSATLPGGSNLLIKDVSLAGKNNLLTVSANGTNLVVTNPTEVFREAEVGVLSNESKTLTVPLVDFSGNITIDAALGSDAITLNAINIGTKSLTVRAESTTLGGALSYTGPVAGSGSSKLVIAGAITLGVNASLDVAFTGVANPTPGQVFGIIDNDGTDPIVGRFSNLPNNGMRLVSNGRPFRVYYNGGDGNDVILMHAPLANVVIVDSAFGNLPAGSFIVDADPVKPGNQNAIVGYNAFGTLAEALDAVTPGGQIIVNAGTLSATLPAAGGLLIQDITAGGKNNLLTVSTDGANVVITSADEVFREAVLGTFSNDRKTLTVPLAGFTGNITIDAALGIDTITLNAINLGTKSLTVRAESTTLAGALTLTGSMNAVAGTAKLFVAGTITLGANASLNVAFTGLVNPTPGQVFRIIDNDGTDPVIGRFANLPNNGSRLMIQGKQFTIYYNGGDGNDVILMHTPTVQEVYVDDDFAGLAPGSFVLDADPLKPGNQNAILGYNAFSSITAALEVVPARGRVNVNAGTYAENVVISREGVTLNGNATNPTLVRIAPSGGVGIRVQANGVTVRDLEVTGATSGLEASQLSDLTLSDLVLRNNDSGGSLNQIGKVRYEGSTVDDFFTATGTSLQMTRGRGASAVVSQKVNMTNVATLMLLGKEGADRFDITPSARGGTAFEVVGGNYGHPGQAGDHLNVRTRGARGVNLQGRQSQAGHAGKWTFANQPSVKFSQIEVFDNVRLAMRQPLPGTAKKQQPLVMRIGLRDTAGNWLTGFVGTTQLRIVDARTRRVVTRMTARNTNGVATFKGPKWTRLGKFKLIAKFAGIESELQTLVQVKFNAGRRGRA